MWSPVMDCAPTQRPVAKLSFLLINVFLLLAPRTASTQQLSGTFPVEERQTAVVRVVPGEFVRARLAGGGCCRVVVGAPSPAVRALLGSSFRTILPRSTSEP